MIDAAPSAFRGRFIRALLYRRLRRGLAGLRIEGLGRIAEEAARGPVLLCANHVSFYDGLLAERLSQAVAEVRVLMRADQLRKAPLLRWVGAVGVEDDPRDGARAVRLAVRFLDRPGRALWIFPQGTLRPQWQRPLGFRGGAELIARRSGAVVLPVSLQYELGEGEQPEAWVRVGEPALPGRLEEEVARGLDALCARIAESRALPSLWPAPRRLGQGIFARVAARALRA